MGFKCGIIGLPNVGKSSLFNALTKLNVSTKNFPFCTIKPNIGIIPVPDQRLFKLANIAKSNNIINVFMKFVDIAGLVKGASEGVGLGNKFLSHIRETEAICHVVRCFENEDVIHISGHIDPIEDIDLINIELILSDLDVCEKAILYISKKQKYKKREKDKILLVLEKCILHLKCSSMLYTLQLSKEEKELIEYLNLLTLKPTIYIANINENGYRNNSYLDKVRSFADKEGTIVIPICASIESDIAKLDDREGQFFIQELGFKESGLHRIIRTGYALLNLQTYFTVGSNEVRAWSIPTGTSAIKAARKIHTDIERGFIRAYIVPYKDFIIYNGEQGAKEAGKMRIEGKNYIVCDGDIIRFLFKV